MCFHVLACLCSVELIPSRVSFFALITQNRTKTNEKTHQILHRNTRPWWLGEVYCCDKQMALVRWHFSLSSEPTNPKTNPMSPIDVFIEKLIVLFFSGGIYDAVAFKKGSNPEKNSRNKDGDNSDKIIWVMQMTGHWRFVCQETTFFVWRSFPYFVSDTIKSVGF